MCDKISEMVTQIRNASSIGRVFVDLPISRVNRNICDVLVSEGFAWDVDAGGVAQNSLRLFLKYGTSGESVIAHIGRVSRSGKRVYAGVRGLDRIGDGFLVLVVSTPKGIVSQTTAKKLGVGGEILVEVW